MVLDDGLARLVEENEAEGLPMFVIGGKAKAGERLETWDDISHANGIRWEALPGTWPDPALTSVGGGGAFQAMPHVSVG